MTHHTPDPADGIIAALATLIVVLTLTNGATLANMFRIRAQRNRAHAAITRIRDRHKRDLETVVANVRHKPTNITWTGPTNVIDDTGEAWANLRRGRR